MTTWKYYILFFGLLCGSLQSFSQYNAYAVDDLSQREMEQLATVVPQGTVIRMGGEEYEHRDYSTSKVLEFTNLISGSVSFMSGDFDNVTKYAELGSHARSEVTFKNEQWLEIEEWRYIKNDFWTYLLHRERYYRNHAQRHISEANAFLEEMRNAGHDVTLVINVPLPQNRNLAAYLNEVSKHNEITKVSIHVYGKWKESDYFTKLRSWLEIIKSYGWDVMCGEMSGLFNHKEGRELKNSDLHRDMHTAIVSTLLAYGITEIYYFTLCANEESLQWKNPQIYNRWLVGDDFVNDELDNVF